MSSLVTFDTKPLLAEQEAKNPTNKIDPIMINNVFFIANVFIYNSVQYIVDKGRVYFAERTARTHKP